MNAQPYIAISGGMGSGKTTLALGLASGLKWQYLPTSTPGVRFLNDLFSDPKRWAFDTQASFLIHKAVQVRDAILRGVPIILDRTLFEDVDVFASHFRSQGAIDDRSYETYMALAKYFFAELPVPDLVIYCKCSLEVAKQRIAKRPRDYQSSYPPEHIHDIYSIYDSWLKGYDRSNMVMFDTEVHDTRQPELLKELCEETKSMVFERTDGQLDLFDITTRPQVFRLLEPFRTIPPARLLSPIVKARVKPVPRATTFPTAYLAAPFTSAAAGSVEKPSLLPETSHGVISRGPYRKLLLSVEKALTAIGINTFIPHRDINKWGRKALKPNQVVSMCSKYIDETDLLIGILSTSHGSHYEVGLALGMGKPVIIIRCKELPESFIAEGIESDSDKLLVVQAEKISDITSAISSDRVLRFLNRFLPIKTEVQ
jgi:deoxyadenosine/deoxycytidine kinase